MTDFTVGQEVVHRGCGRTTISAIKAHHEWGEIYLFSCCGSGQKYGIWYSDYWILPLPALELLAKAAE